MPQLIPRINERNNFIVLLCGLVFFLCADAVVDQFQLEYSQRAVNITLMVFLIVNVWAIDNPRTDIISWKWGATMAIALTMITDSLIESNFLAKFQIMMAFLFLCLTIWQAWSQVMFTGVVDRNKVVGSICIYLLLGMAWAFAYLIVEAYVPGSIKGLREDLWQNNIHSLIYYSMVTLTTLGYGDITPAQPLTRFLAYMEAVTGVFYMAILVASLIGIRLAGVDPGKSIDELEAGERKRLASDSDLAPRE